MQDLPRLVMRRAAAVALAVLGLALLLGLWRTGEDIEDEVDAAMVLAHQIARLAELAQLPDDQALQQLASLRQQGPLRHVVLTVQATDGRMLMGPAAEAPQPWPLRQIVQWHRALFDAPDARRATWQMPRPGGGAWTVSLAASHDSERREAVASLLGALGLLLLCVAGLLLVMRWNVRRALAPLDGMLSAIQDIERQDNRAVRALPPMPIRELEAMAAALRHLAGALDAAQAERRLLSQQVLSLQDDERARLARELHDEYGQRLTAMRVDAAWLARRTADQPELRLVVDSLAGHCQHIQQDIRALLARLQPLGPPELHGGPSDLADGPVMTPLARLHELLEALVQAWQAADRPPAAEGSSTRTGTDGPVPAPAASGRPSTRWQLQWHWQGSDGRPVATPDARQAELALLPHALALTLYRISQEALTNIARHAQARQAVLRLDWQGATAPGAELGVVWTVEDDGVGLDGPGDAQAVRRGNGLAGLRERIWAQGANLHSEPARADAARPGLRLQARFRGRWG